MSKEDALTEIQWAAVYDDLTFGSEQRHEQVCEVVRVGVRAREGPDNELELFTVPSICEPLVCQPIELCVEKFDHFRGVVR